MTRCISLVLGLCLLSLIAVVLLSASPEEKLERSLSRLQSADSLNELNRVYGAGDRTPNLLIRRAELLLAKGEVDEAKRTYEALASISETELLARNAMAEAAINLGDIPAAVAQLKEAHALDPSPESLDRLARLYELTRDTDAERGILLTATPDTLSDRSARRLLDLSILEGSMGAAETLLRARAEVASPARSQMRGYLAELLVGSDRADEAATLGAEWFGRNHNSVALSLTVSRLIERGFVDPAENSCPRRHHERTSRRAYRHFCLREHRTRHHCSGTTPRLAEPEPGARRQRSSRVARIQRDHE